MFNLIVSGSGWEPRRDSFGSGRGLEYTDAAIAHRFMPNKVLDKLHGTGTFHYKDGAKYIGDWREDKRDGTGIYALKRVAISMSASGRRANPMAAERRHLLIEQHLWVSIKRANATAKAFCMQQTDQYKGQGCG